ncbi:MAG: MBL fold metallo-hydrolase [Deltaproteobacteria bacterium]|nr:MBL fold metallo-hydrolase [Deltaproteobacteria bacterium]
MDRALGRVTVLGGERDGKYPHGNSLLVAGSEETIVVDPSLSLVTRIDRPRVDRVLNSHCHEDHLAGNHLFPDVPWHLHEADLPGLASIDAMMAIYGMSPAIEAAFRRVVVEELHFAPRPDATAFRDRFTAVIATREARLLAYLAAPRTLDEIVAHRFVYRPGDAVPFADDVERRSMRQHLERLCAAGRVREVEPGRFLAA